MKLIARLSSQQSVDAFFLKEIGGKRGVVHCAQREFSIQPRKGVSCIFHFKNLPLGGCGKQVTLPIRGRRNLIARCDQKVLQRQIPGEVFVCLAFLISMEADMGTWASGILERKEEGELNAKLLW